MRLELKAPWQKDDRRGLTGAVARATSKRYPTTFSAIAREVWDDYGTVNTRTIYRHLSKLVDRGCVLKVKVPEVRHAIYVRPKHRLDVETMQDYDYAHTETAEQRHARKTPRATQ